jgi:hypothetical protein
MRDNKRGKEFHEQERRHRKGLRSWILTTNMSFAAYVKQNIPLYILRLPLA